jgi:hypothetical protein
MTSKAMLPAVLITLLSQTALAEGIKMPGISIDENGIKAPVVEITGDGISTDGVEIDDRGIKAPGVTIDDSGISAPGVRIDAGERSRIHEQRRPGRYHDEFFTADGAVRRDKFENMDLRGYNFAGYRLERVKFKDTDLKGVDFRGARHSGKG